jgi:hypothetical protein
MVGAAAFVSLTPEFASSSCNQIPSADVLRTKSITDSGKAPSEGAANFADALSDLTWNGEIPYKGALGRASRSLIVPQSDIGVTVASDFTCVRGVVDAGPRGSVEREDLVSAIFYYRRAPNGRVAHVFARLFADDDEYCEEIDAGLPLRDGDAPDAEFEFSVIEDCTRDQWRIVGERQRGENTEYKVALPILPGDVNADRGVDAEVRVAVLREPAANELGALVRSVAAASKCADRCGQTGATTGLDVCVDELYQTDTIDGGVAVAFSLDPVSCNIAIPQSGIQCGENDYQKLCTSPDMMGFAECKGASSGVNEIAFWRSKCGGIHFPFSWGEIRADPADPNDPDKNKDRVLAGMTATARKKKQAGVEHRIYLPGKEFTGSTDCVSQCSDPPCTNAGDWRIPEIDLWAQAAGATTLGLTGVVDKNASVIHVYPRTKAAIQCKDPNDPAKRQGCMKVDRYQGKRRALCACRDREPVGCDCLQTATPRFFECEAPPNWTGAYEFAGLPCMRHDHCPFGGYCSADPTCLDEDKAIWKKNASLGTVSCQDETPCANGEVCGFRLFDFSERVDATTGVGKLRRKVTGAPNSAETRGYCSNKRDKRCKKHQNCKGAAICSLGQTCECTGFLASAEGSP